MKLVCQKCNTEFRVWFRSSGICPNCGEIVGGEKPKPKVPNYNIIPVDESETSVGLIEAGKVYPGVHVCESEIHPLLMEMASRHSKYQAERDTQGHQLFQKRVEELFETMGQFLYAEICAESWPRQANESKFELGTEMYRCWEQSPGHWNVAKKKHKYFGANMAQGKSGIWYATIIVAD